MTVASRAQVTGTSHFFNLSQITPNSQWPELRHQWTQHASFSRNKAKLSSIQRVSFCASAKKTPKVKKSIVFLNLAAAMSFSPFDLQLKRQLPGPYESPACQYFTEIVKIPVLGAENHEKFNLLQLTQFSSNFNQIRLKDVPMGYLYTT